MLQFSAIEESILNQMTLVYKSARDPDVRNERVRVFPYGVEALKFAERIGYIFQKNNLIYFIEY